jgi:DNA-binding NarL/FixJ family response regulator
MLELADFRPGGGAICPAPVVRGFADEAARAAVGTVPEDRTAADPALPPLMQQYVPGQVATRLRGELVTDAEWLRSPHMRQLARDVGIFDAIYAAVPGASAMEVIGFGIHRTGAGARFRPEERDLVQFFFEQARFVFDRIRRAQASRSPVARAVLFLRRHERNVLSLLLTGLQEKEVAQRLDLSEHTVHEYIRALYSHFGVTSRTQLLARFIPPDGASPAASARPGGPLPPRLREVLLLMLAGLSEKEVGQRLGLSRNTVHDYAGDLFAHFGVVSRAELLARFIRLDLMPAPEPPPA